MKLTEPRLVLTFLGNDLETGHQTTQTIDHSWIVNYTPQLSKQLLNGLKSSSDQMSMTIFRKCPSIEDIIATEGNIKVQVYDEDDLMFTGFLSTNYSWTVTDHGEQALQVTIESVGTRLFSRPFIETGHYFFNTTASAAVYEIINPLGITLRSGDERKLLQNIQKEVEAGTTCRDLLDSLFYECNAVYFFNEKGELCVVSITADTTDAHIVSSDHLFTVNKKAVSLSKSLRTYKGARIQFAETGNASNYLVYRNTSGQDTTHPYCHFKLAPGEWYDGAEIYTDQEWSAATADTFREPTLISAVNASSESSIVGSNEILAISNATQAINVESGITVSIEAVGGKWFKITCHNTAGSDRYINRLDLYADIVYQKSTGIVRTQETGPTDGKSLLEEEMKWIHDKGNAQKHANLLAQYYKSCGASYTFFSDEDITLGSVIELKDTVFSGLDVFVLVYAQKTLSDSDIYEYKAVGISSFNLSEPVYHGTTESAKQSGAQGPSGEPGASTEVQYAIGQSIIYPPTEAMQWGGEDMLWNGETMLWSQGLYSDNVPDMERGKYIWMRTRVGDSPWQYTRLTGSTSWDAENLGVCTTACPTESSEGLGLIPGDYFVAGATFTDSGVTYNAGYAYTYNGTTWTGLDLSNEENARKALDLLSALSSAEIQIPSATSPYSVWLWAKNFVAQNAVIENLFAEHITLLESGCIHSDYYKDDGTPNLTASGSTDSERMTVDGVSEDTWFNAVGYIVGTFSWEVVGGHPWGADFDPIDGNPLSAGTDAELWEKYGIDIYDARQADIGDIVTVTVSSVTGATSGFWLGANGELKCCVAEARNLYISGDSFFQGRLNCDVIKTVQGPARITGTYSATSSTSQAKNLINAFPSNVRPNYPSGGTSSLQTNWSDYLPVSMTTPQGTSSDIAYVRLCRSNFRGTLKDIVYFYDENRTMLPVRDYFTLNDSSMTLSTTTVGESVTGGSYATTTVTINTVVSGNVLEVDIPDSPSGLTKGQLYHDNGIVKIVTT